MNTSPERLLAAAGVIERADEKFGISAAVLQRKHFAPIRWIVPEVLTEGLTIFAGRPKRGKSWLALNLASAIACGGAALGSLKCEQGDVLALMLEDNDRRLQDRMRQLWPNSNWPNRLTFCSQTTGWPTAAEGGIGKMERWVETVERPAAIIVDIFQKVRPPPDRNKTPYQNDYEAGELLQKFAMKHQIALMAITHCRKGKSEEDVLEEVSGTNGQTAAADSVLVLQRGEGRADYLYGRGRDLPEFERAISFDKITGHWTLLGDADEHRGNQVEMEIMKVLLAAGRAVPTKDIAATFPTDQYDAIRVRLDRMADHGRIRKVGKGLYETL